MKKFNTHSFAHNLMGHLVLVNTVLRRNKQYNGPVTWAPDDQFREPRAGWIVGVRWLQVGKHEPGGYDCPGHIAPTGTVLAVMVAFWPTERPVPVPLDGFETMYDASRLAYPFPSVCGRSMGATARTRLLDAYRKDMAERPQDYPRDKRGRFTGERWPETQEV